MCCLSDSVNCLVKQLAICLGGVVVINVMVLFSMVRGAILDIPCMVFQREGVVPVIPVCLDTPSMCFVCLFGCIFQSFESWITGVCSPYV